MPKTDQKVKQKCKKNQSPIQNRGGTKRIFNEGNAKTNFGKS